MLQPKSNLSEKWQSSCSVDRAQPKHGFLSAQKHAAAIFICTSMAAERRLSAAQGSNYNVSACVHVCGCVHGCVFCAFSVCCSGGNLQARSSSFLSMTRERIQRKNEGIEAAVIAMRGSGNYLLGALSLSISFGLFLVTSLPRSTRLLCVVRQDEMNWELNSPPPPPPPHPHLLPKSIMQTEVVNCPHICMQRVNELYKGSVA